MNNFPHFVTGNAIYNCELEGVICHMAPSYDSKLLQSVQSVGAKRCHLTNGTFLRQANNDFSNGTYEFFLQNKGTV